MTFRVARLLMATPILASIALLSPASECAPATKPSLGHAESSGAPSRLDYLLLASLADSSSLLAMAAYRTPEKGLRSD
jgi:hypothetical protein